MQKFVTLSDTTEEQGFWSRQFSNEVTSAQSGFDLIVGIMAPVLCFIFDPVVFNNRLGVIGFNPDLSRFKLLVYLFSGLSILTFFVPVSRSGIVKAIAPE
jgi:hypothetical protein